MWNRNDRIQRYISIINLNTNESNGNEYGRKTKSDCGKENKNEIIIKDGEYRCKTMTYLNKITSSDMWLVQWFVFLLNSV